MRRHECSDGQALRRLHVFTMNIELKFCYPITFQRIIYVDRALGTC